MPLDKSNSNSDYLRDKVDTSNYYNLRTKHSNGKKSKINAFLDSGNLVVSIKRGKNLNTSSIK